MVNARRLSLAVSELVTYSAVQCSVAVPEIHFVRRPRQVHDDALCILSLIGPAQAHYAFVSFLEREGGLLFWNETMALKLELTRGNFIKLRSHLLWRKYLFITPAGMVPALEDMDAAVYVPYENFASRFSMRIFEST